MKKLHLIPSLIFAFTVNPVFAAPVNINQASATEIATALKGVGESKAAAIVEYRNLNGEFVSAEQLTQVKGIGEKLVSKIKADVLLK